MPPLADVQARLRDALVVGGAARVLPLLIGGRDPGKRLAVHQRHYETSLVSALLTKFPATVWLMGSEWVAEAARAFIRRQPPHAPCIAEFGATFPDSIANATGAARVMYLRDFAQLEWHLGHAAVAIEKPSISLSSLSAYPQDALPDLALRLQPGVHYLAAPWPVDELIQLHLEDRAPERYCMVPSEVRLEIRGSRGAFSMTRRDTASFAFRRAIHAGAPIGVAAETVLDTDATFDPGEALTALMNEGLVVGIRLHSGGALQ